MVLIFILNDVTLKTSNRLNPESNKIKKANMQTLAKNQVTAIFLVQDTVEKRFTQISRDLYGDAGWSFATKKRELSLEELKNIKVRLFLIRELFR